MNRHTLRACTQVWDVCAGQAGRDPADPKLLHESSEKALVWAPVVKMGMKWGEKKKRSGTLRKNSIL